MANAIAKDRKFALMGFAIGMVIIYANLSAYCATGGSCIFANGDFFHWIATTILR